jgi:hypothetical protein
MKLTCRLMMTPWRLHTHTHTHTHSLIRSHRLLNNTTLHGPILGQIYAHFSLLMTIFKYIETSTVNDQLSHSIYVEPSILWVLLVQICHCVMASGGMWPVSPSARRITRPLGVTLIHVMLPWCSPSRSQASAGNCRALYPTHSTVLFQ